MFCEHVDQMSIVDTELLMNEIILYVLIVFVTSS